MPNQLPPETHHPIQEQTTHRSHWIMSLPPQEAASPAVVDQPGHRVIMFSGDELKEEFGDLSKTHWWKNSSWVIHGSHHHMPSHPDAPPHLKTPDLDINQ